MSKIKVLRIVEEDVEEYFVAPSFEHALEMWRRRFVETGGCEMGDEGEYYPVTIERIRYPVVLAPEIQEQETPR